MLLKSFLIGFLWGSCVSVFNHYYLKRVIKKNEGQPPDKGMLAIINCYIVRYFINIAALFAVYRNMWMLAGTAAGLTVMMHISILRYLKSRKTSRAPKK
ncbi:MAG: hypothetical protein HPY58_03630 [Firmicutes bacterium]|nr:hypothetical protein [Bacillota bacterium]